MIPITTTSASRYYYYHLCYYCTFFVVISTFQISFINADVNNDYEYYDDENGQQQQAVSATQTTTGGDDDNNSNNNNNNGCLMVVCMSLIFALCISFCGTVMVYVTYLEDIILTKYQKEAFLVRADVCSAEFARRTGGGNNNNNKQDDNNIEYTATIEYNQIISDSYRIRVRKKIKALESDFIHPDDSIMMEGNGDRDRDGGHGTTSNTGSSSSLQLLQNDDSASSLNPSSSTCKKKKNNNKDGGGDDDIETPKQQTQPQKTMKRKSSNSNIIINQASFFDNLLLEHKCIDILVLNGKELSGYPKRLLERRLCWKQRISSVLCTILSTLCLTSFCIYMAIRATIEDSNDEYEKNLATMSLVVFSILMVLELPFIYTYLKGMIVPMLEEEYYETADLTRPNCQHDDSSLSTRSDLFKSTSSISLK